MDQYPRLFSPLAIGAMTIQNRIVMPAMHLSYAENGFINDRLTNFYVERARHEIGLIIIGGCYVDPLGMGVDSMIAIDDDKYIEGLQAFSGAIHDASSTKAAVQLYHAGRYSFDQIIKAQPVSSAAKYSSFSKSMPRALTVDEIHETINKFADAAGRARKAGFDAVEIVGSAGYLVDQFMSPLVNDRTDEYGGSFENRLRFPVELVKACKKALGSGVPLIMRYSGHDLVPGSNTLQDKVRIAPVLQEAGLDALNVTGGWHESRVPSITMNVPPGAFSYFSREIKRAVSIPVFCSNRINDPAVAEWILATRRADAACVGRGLICDAAFAEKARAGRSREIRKCIACNQGCFDAVFTLSPVCCLRNPVAGFEGEKDITKAEIQRRVLVAGAGVAGLECARVAAMRGHHVELHESAGQIGGQALLAAAPPGREDIAEIVRWYRDELARLGVPVHLNSTVDVALAERVAPDVVVLATGALSKKPPIPGIDLPIVHLAWDYLDPAKNVDPGETCVVIGGGATGVETALSLAEHGAFEPEIAKFMHYFAILDAEKAWAITGTQRKVHVVELLDKIGTNFGKSTRWIMLQDLERHGVEVITGAKVARIEQQDDGRGTITMDTASGERAIRDVDAFFVATSVVSEASLEASLKARWPVHKIGDARKPKDLMKAIADGFKQGTRL